MGATLNMMDGATILGSTATADEMATVKIDGGSADIDSSSIINTGQTGTAIHIENSGATLTDIIVKNAAVGIASYNGAPQVDGFTSTGNTVGVDAYGGMSLPTIYRSTSLSGMAAGWHTYKIDLSTYLGTGDYLQVGANSVWAGGNAHPVYNFATGKYYFITDRMNIMFEDDQGNSRGTSRTVAKKDTTPTAPTTQRSPLARTPTTEATVVHRPGTATTTATTTDPTTRTTRVTSTTSTDTGSTNS